MLAYLFAALAVLNNLFIDLSMGDIIHLQGIFCYLCATVSPKGQFLRQRFAVVIKDLPDQPPTLPKSS